MMFHKTRKEAYKWLRSSHYGPTNGALRKAHTVVKTTRTVVDRDTCDIARESGYTIVMR